MVRKSKKWITLKLSKKGLRIIDKLGLDKALEKYKLTNKDILMIVSNSGVNHAPVEAALIAKKKKIKTIAITSYNFSKQAPLSKLKKRLYQIVDIYIDNKIPAGDSIIKINI